MKNQNAKIQSLLEELYENKSRVRIWYGDTKTGLSWNDENDVIGRISKSMGPNKIFILVNNSRSMGGSALLESCIIRIDIIKTKQTVYKHKNFHVNLAVQNNKVVNSLNNQEHATFFCQESAFRYLAFQKGERYSK